MNKTVVGLLRYILATLLISGCATYGQNQQSTLSLIQKQSYGEAEVQIKENLGPDGADRLLYLVELAIVKHLAKEYQASNRLLEQAEQLADALYATEIGDLFLVAMTNPTFADYKGSEFEYAFINYFKSLNYLMLYQQSNQIEHLDDARVEIRRLEILLDKISHEKGSYKEQEDEDSQTFGQLVSIFRQLEGDSIDPGAIEYRDDAWGHYLAGLMYEITDELDDARISYRRSAQVYEDGYSDQYELGQEIVYQAWFDTIRVMIKSGGWESEWPTLSEDKLDVHWRNRLKDYTANTSEIVVIEHQGLVPPKEELNLHLYSDPISQSLIIRPVLTGTQIQRQDQFSWFYLVYADKGLFDMIRSYAHGGLYGLVPSIFSGHRVDMSLMWPIASQIGLIEAMGSFGIRVTVPYYPSLRNPPESTAVVVDGESIGSIVKSESLAQIALQEQLRNAKLDMRSALGRESLKTITAHLATNEMTDSNRDLLFGLLVGLASKATVAATSQAETRSWLTLPYSIGVRRIPVSPGVHTIELNPQTGVGTFDTVSVAEGQIFVLQERLISPSSLQVADGTSN